MPAQPLISCLMATLPAPERLAGLKLSIADYLRQTHPGRELVVVVDGRHGPGTAPAIKAHVAGLGRDDIRIIEPAAAPSLGALRNVSLEAARGDVVCVWDDDDLRHPERLSRQLSALEEADGEAICLQHAMQYLPAERRLYCLTWNWPEVRGLPPSLMFRRDLPVAYPETGEHAELGEDMVVIRQLQARGRFHLLADQPHLYVYVSHGKNAYDETHHREVLRMAISRGLLARREAALRRGLAAFDFGGPVTVEGFNGPAFVIAAGA